MDTTASQAGPCYFAQRIFLQDFTKKLGANDRIAIWNVNTKTTDLTKGFVPGNSAKVNDALKDLDQFVPMGAATSRRPCDRDVVLRRPGEPPGCHPLPRRRHQHAQSDRRGRALADRREMVDRKVGFFPVPLGPELDPQVIHGFATGTGGTVLRLDVSEKIEDTLKRFKNTIAQPVLYVDSFKLPAEVVEFYPTKLPPLRGDAPTLVVGRLSAPTAKFDVSIAGKVDGKHIHEAQDR